MKSTVLVVIASCIAMVACPVAMTAEPLERQEFASEPQVDRVGNVDGAVEASKVLGDTAWIADWSFDDGAGCTDAGWLEYDGRILNDGSNHWSIRLFGACLNSRAAVLAKHDLTWVRDGYGNNWDYSIICLYKGASTLSFDFLNGGDGFGDFTTVEADSAGASESRVDYAVNPAARPSDFRTELLTLSNGGSCATVTALALPDFGVPATIHEVYIRFTSDGSYSDEDGFFTSPWNAGLVVDNITVAGGFTYSEGFDLADPNINIRFENTAPATPFGEWARLFPHVSDNDQCTENTSCAWIFTDPMRPAFLPDMAFGPGGAVIHNWLDDIIVSPWVSLPGTPGASGTLLTYRRMPGNNFSWGRIVQNWSVRSKVRIDNTDTSILGDSIDAVGSWRHAANWNSLTNFGWITSVVDMSPHVPAGAREIQVRFRVSDWQYISGAAPPSPLDPGPGPYVDRVRIGRRILTGPVFNPGLDVRSQAQDCFPTYRNSTAPGEHFSPTTDIFGTCAFSEGTDLGRDGSTGYNVVTGDSISMGILDVRGAGGIAEVRWYGAITQGPHTGKAPSPYTVAGNGFFEVTPDSARDYGGSAIEGRWFVDLDDTYFRGGDRLLYFWSAVDASGGRASFPEGITATNFPPASPAAAELATGGLVEVSFLPTIDWDPSYLAAIAADQHGDIDPSPVQIANSSQRNCILYYAAGFSGIGGRRSGDPNRTSFMYTLDRLGYRGHYDVYDHQGYGNTCNQLAGRATVAQCSGYALIIHDTGRGNSPNIPDGIDWDSEKVNQCQWYRDYLAQGSTSQAGIANLWLIGEDNAYEKQTNPLISTDFGLTSVIDDQGLAANPDVAGQTSFTSTTGNVADFTGDVFSLNGSCVQPLYGSSLVMADFDAAASSGSAVVTHRYASGGTTGAGAVVMNKNATLGWNTIWMGFAWFDIVGPLGDDPASGTGAPDTRLARKILDAALPVDCHEGENPTDIPGPQVDAVPSISTLHPNVPNPFNPTTTIRFDLARSGHVQLRIYDVAGRLVATLVDGDMAAGFGKSVLWNGLDVSGGRAPSGVYFSQLVTVDARATRKMILLQ